MKRSFLKSTLLASIVLCGFSGTLPAIAQSAWPAAKPIRVIVNFPPGGAADQIARAVAAPLAEALGQSVVVENRAGAGGNIGGEAVAKSPADGYTLLMSSGGMVSINPALYSKMLFDPTKDIVPVAAAARVLVFLEARANLPVKSDKDPSGKDFNAKEFLAYMKANPGRLSFGTPGNGSSPHLAAEMMKSQAGVFATHIPYRGAAPAMQDLLAGQVDFMFDPGIGFAHVKSGRLKMLAVGSPKRSPMFPDVPTLDEVGLKGFDADSVFGFYAPAGTPADVIARLNREINKALTSKAVSDRILGLGGEPLPITPAEFAAKMEGDAKRFSALIKERKITGD